MNEIYTQLKQYGKVKLNESLKKHVTMKVGGTAKYFLIVDDIDKLADTLKYLDGEGIAHVILGGGSNTLFSDTEFDGVVVKVESKKLKVESNVIIADAGCITATIARESMAAGLTGFEWGVGVPGTIGGAVRGNAGAMGSEMKDNVLKVEAYIDGEVVEFSNEEIQFGYRDSIFKHDGGVVLRVYLKLDRLREATAHQGKELMKKALEHLKYRNETQPQGFASSGCMFKNPDWETHKKKIAFYFNTHEEPVTQFACVGKISAGWLIQNTGLRGFKIGGAQVSEKHCNFVVNTGDATVEDIQALIAHVKQKVWERYDIMLEEEVSIL